MKAFLQISGTWYNYELKEEIDLDGLEPEQIPIVLIHALSLNKGDVVMVDIPFLGLTNVEAVVDYKWYCLASEYGDPHLIVTCDTHK